ncbi:MAG: 16S rRNA (cytidine(1402)-2'-O)-methyltransferase [Endomicrobium sp.]|jgi:16S rRNA (cytidine1402-2'-O)-methyltransferase|nr:16S rRNA (cytidine(1402)-2'-O)-methyltransferase [Endomicrobium sp.]
MTGILYIVPTPIGNLEDITLRALRILRECNLIACEDTRRSLKLLTHFNISKPLLSFYSYNEQHKCEYIINRLLSGDKISLISDAGTPGISDPGYFLINKAISKKIKIETLAGACAITTALVASGFPTNGFVFCGFLKRKRSKIEKYFLKLLKFEKTIIFYESPYRLLKTIKICENIFGESAKICIAKEMTKKFEKFIRGTIKDVLNIMMSNNSLLIGEFVVLIYHRYDKKINKNEKMVDMEKENK